jgi:hypothetical protein
MIPKAERMDKPQPNKKDAILQLARASLADKRRRTPAHIAILVGVPLLVLGLLIWWIYPKPELPKLRVEAFDQVALPDEPALLVARVEPVAASEASADLSGCPLFFLDMKTGQLLGKVTSGNNGLGSIETRFPAANTPYEMLVRYPGEENRRRGVEAGCQLYVWPSESSLLIVDADRVLPGVDEAKLWTQPNLDIRSQADAAGVLRATQTSYRTVYLAASANSAARYHKLRAWLSYMRASSSDSVPAGPLLASAAFPGSGEDFHRLILARLKKQFNGKLIGFTDDPDRAKLFRELGLQSILLSKTTEAPEGVELVKSWKELGEKLTKKSEPEKRPRE